MRLSCVVFCVVVGMGLQLEMLRQKRCRWFFHGLVWHECIDRVCGRFVSVFDDRFFFLSDDLADLQGVEAQSFCRF